MSIAPYLQKRIHELQTENDALNDLVNLQAANTVALEAQLKARTAERDKLGEALTDAIEEKEMAEAELNELRLVTRTRLI